MLLNEIRDLYDQVLELEPSVESKLPTSEPAIKEPEIIPEPAPIPTPQPEVITKAEVEVDPFSDTTAKPTVEVLPHAEDSNVRSETPVSEEMDSDEGTLAGKLNQKPISDLRTGIPLNEKFSFIQNLFQNNASDYADAILKLNNAEDQTTALAYFERKVNRRGWDVKDSQVRSFKNYVERRHMYLAETSKANADQ